MKRSIDGTVYRAAARLEEEAPQFRSAAVQVARPPSLAQRGNIGGVGLDRVPGDYVGAASAAASAAVRPSPFEEPKDDIRKLLAAEDSKPAAAAAAGAAAAPSESNWAIDGGSTSLRSIPTYYPLEKSSRCVSLGGRGVEDITARISDCCRIMSVHAEYEGGGDVPVSFVCLFGRLLGRREGWVSESQ